MRRARIAVYCFAIPFTLLGQEAAILRNDGQAIRVPFACTSENLDWAGLACADDDPCSIYLELNTVAAAGKNLFLAGDLHAQSATLSSILLASDDGGLTWKEPAPRVRGAALDQFQFYDAQRGWTSGETVYPLARDPFFLITSDGGESWRNRAVTDEGGPGRFNDLCSIRRSMGNCWWMAARARRVDATRDMSPIPGAILVHSIGHRCCA